VAASGVDRTRKLRDFWIQDLSFVDARHGWALGYFALPKPGLVTLQSTDDGGRTWHLVTPPTTEPGQPVTGVSFVDREDGWACGPALYATHDGGGTWTRVRLGAPVDRLASAGHTAWAIAGRHVWESPARSDRWHRVAGAPTIDGDVLGLVRRGPDQGWLLWRSGPGPEPAFSHLVTTSDGGTSWRPLALPCGEDWENQNLSAGQGALWLFCGSEPGAGSQLGSLYRSMDRGRSWAPMVRESNFVCCPHLFARSATVGWLDDAYFLLATNDGGRTWQKVLDGNGGGWGAVFTGRRAGLAWSQQSLFLTVDAGRHWRHVPIEPSGCG